MAATILTATDLADKLGTDSRTTRKFLRAITPRDEQPGKGSRWGIEAKKVRSLTPKFRAWEADQAEKAATRAAALEVVAEIDANQADIEDLTNEVDEEPTDEELALLEDEAITD